MDEKELDHILRLSVERMNRSVKVTNYQHHGFDFDQEAGHDKLVTDNLKNRLRNALMNQISTGPLIGNLNDLGGSYMQSSQASIRRDSSEVYSTMSNKKLKSFKGFRPQSHANANAKLETLHSQQYSPPSIRGKEQKNIIPESPD